MPPRDQFCFFLSTGMRAAAIPAPSAVLIRPDGYVAWVGDLAQVGLADALATGFGPPRAASRA
jgi:hypothetical protein